MRSEDPPDLAFEMLEENSYWVPESRCVYSQQAALGVHNQPAASAASASKKMVRGQDFQTLLPALQSAVQHQHLCDEWQAGETGSSPVYPNVWKEKVGVQCSSTSAEFTSLATSSEKDYLRLQECSLDSLQGVTTQHLTPRMSIPLDTSVVQTHTSKKQNIFVF